MRYLPFLFFFLSLSSLGQKNEAFRIDSLPAEGILLNKGWKWHAGDNPAWAKADFNDTKWETIDPTKDINDLPQIRKAGMGWFRIHIMPDSALANTILSMAINQGLASEFYRNGKLIGRLGTLNVNPEQVKTYNPQESQVRQVIHLYTGNDRELVMAVRFSLQSIQRYGRNYGLPATSGLRITLLKSDIYQANGDVILEKRDDINLNGLDYARAAMLLMLGMIHLFFYVYYRLQKANLYFGVYCILSFIIGNLLPVIPNFFHDLSDRNIFLRLQLLSYLCLTFFLLGAIYRLFNYPIGKYFKVLAIGGGIMCLGVFSAINIDLPWLILNLLILAEAVRVSIVAYLAGKDGALILVVGTIGYLVFRILYFVNLSQNFIPVPEQILFSFAVFSIAISITLFLAKDFAKNAHALSEKLTEIEFLSAEREQILTTQNETLELQVSERTAELSHKNQELVIEAALERVRSQSMAMRHSDDLQQVITVVSEQLQALGFQFDMVNFVVDRADKGWDCYNAVPVNDTILNFTIPYFNHRLFTDAHEVHRQKLDFNTYALTLAEKNEWFNHLFTNTVLKELPAERKQFIINLPGMAASVVVWPDISLSIINYQEIPYTEAENAVFKRFGLVFGQAYTRFKDLKKAEEQAREAQIEAALERVRSQSMAMQHSDHLLKVVHVINEQLQALNFELGMTNFIKSRANAEDGCDSYNAIPGISTITGFYIPYLDHRIFNQIYESLQQGLDFFSYVLTEEEKFAFLKHSYENTVLKDVVPEERKQQVYNFPGWASSVILFSDKKLTLSIIKFQSIPYTDEENAIFRRFGAVFEQAYTRFLDLQKAEELAREAVRTASLDRVRAQIASMRTTQDLERITPLIWSELTVLEVPFFRCGIFIVNEAEQRIHAFLSTPDGQARTQLNLPMDGAENSRQIVQNWQQQQIYTDRWNRQQLQQWVQSMVNEGQIESAAEYTAGDMNGDSFSLQFVPFTQGMLYIGSAEPLTVSQMDLTQSLANTFSVAYARYEDFRQLEEAKARVDLTLTELKATQTQLIQKEKLASLGELTAGIAHEIQNPLNFVNNFSELSVELIEELGPPAPNGGAPEAPFGGWGAFLTDITQNLEKINHHGQRASSIVKGMLEHSRTTTGERQLTNINQLADEYLRLSYHGLKAKDSTFSADYELIAEENLPLVNVVPQEIGRVLLNLINNAFYAVNQRAKSENDAYHPKVTVSTKQKDNQVHISVQDNGAGIPAAIQDKIFHPFFTTKPTGEGTGLGLSLSYDIVTKGHGGTLTVETKEGERTTFIIQLHA